VIFGETSAVEGDLLFSGLPSSFKKEGPRSQVETILCHGGEPMCWGIADSVERGAEFDFLSEREGGKGGQMGTSF